MATDSPRTPTDGARPQRAQFATTDPDEAEAFLDRMYAAQAGGTAFHHPSPLALSQVTAGGLSSVDFTMPPKVTLHLDGTDDLSVSTVIQGAGQTERGKDLERHLAGDVLLGSFPRGAYTVDCDRLRAQIMTIPATAWVQAAGALPGDRSAPLRFASLAPSSPAAGEHWKRVAAFARGVLDDDETAASPPIIGSVTRLLATTALAVFPNNLAPEPGPTASRAMPDTVRRAEEYLHAHAHTDVCLADLAAACHVTPRALQYAFARHHQMSPMRYLRRIRLDRAHRDLVAADPAGTTVTAVATRWGFARPSRFAAEYRAAYGTHPSQSLRAGSG